MTLRLSQLYGMDIFSSEAGKIGKVYDVILNMEKGDVVRITLEPLKTGVSKADAQEILKRKSILYTNVISVKDIMIVSRAGRPVTETREERPEQKKPAVKHK